MVTGGATRLAAVVSGGATRPGWVPSCQQCGMRLGGPPMRKTVRLFSETGPEERLGNAIAQLPASARRALAQVADREDLPLVAGSWATDSGGCLVANVVRSLSGDAPTDSDLTLDLRVLELLPELSSRDLNRLIVAWDEAAAQEGRSGDGALRRLLRGALARAGEPAEPAPVELRPVAAEPGATPEVSPADGPRVPSRA